MRDNPGDELDPAVDVCRRWKNSPFFLTCIDKRTKEESCDRGKEVGIVHSGRDGEGAVPLKKPKESGKRGNCEKDFVFR